MSAPMKKPRIENSIEITFRDKSNRLFRLPRERAKGLLTLIQDFEVKDDGEIIPADEVFKDLHNKYGKGGSILRGLRAREGLTQVELAEQLGVPQTDISQIETGKRTIGRKMSERIGKVFHIDYRVFL